MNGKSLGNIYYYLILKLDEHSDPFKLISRSKVDYIIGKLFPKLPRQLKRSISDELINMNMLSIWEKKTGNGGARVFQINFKEKIVRKNYPKANRKIYLKKIGLL